MKLEFDTTTKLNQILEQIKASSEVKLELQIPADSFLLANPINKKIIEKFALEVGKQVSFLSGESLQVPTDDLGFVEGQDVAALPVAQVSERAQPHATFEEPTEKRNKIFFNFSALIGKFKSIPKIWLAAVALTIFLGGSFFVFAWWLPSAEVILTYEGQKKDSSSELTVVVGGTFDESEKQIPATTEEVIKNDLATANATGKKSVGDPAKGRVTIVNYSTSERFFPKGTVVTPTKGGVTFTLDNDVSASASAGFGDHKDVGVNVTAKAAGPEGNLPSGTNFTVGTAKSDDVFARNDTPFSGGSIRNITVVSDTDRKNLRSQLVKTLTEKAKAEIESNNSAGIIPEGGVEVSVSKETYDAEAGQEADKVSLSLEVTAKVVVLKREDLISILTKTMSIPSGFKVSEKDSSTSATFIEKTAAETYKISGKIDAVLVPDLDLNQVKKNLAAKTLGAAKSYLDSLEGIKSHTIDLRPAFYAGIGWLPFSASKINVILEKAQ